MNTLIACLILVVFPLSSLAQEAVHKKAQTTANTAVKTAVKTKAVETDDVIQTHSVETKTTTVNDADGAQTTAVETDVKDETVLTQGAKRADSSVVALIEYSPLDLLIPSKIGGSVGFNNNRSLTYELEYLGASIAPPFIISHIGNFSDKRVSAVARLYNDRNSFNVHFGFSYFDTDIHVGSELLASATNLPAYQDLMRSETVGLVVGIGNRWILPHGITLGVDWFSWAQPLIVLNEDSSVINSIQDQGAKQTLQNAFHLAMFFPRFVLFKVAAGFTF